MNAMMEEQENLAQKNREELFSTVFLFFNNSISNVVENVTKAFSDYRKDNVHLSEKYGDMEKDLIKRKRILNRILGEIEYSKKTLQKMGEIRSFSGQKYCHISSHRSKLMFQELET